MQIKIINIVKTKINPASCPDNFSDEWEVGVNAKFFVSGYYKRASLIYQCDNEKLTHNGWEASKSELRRYGWNFMESGKLTGVEPSSLALKHLLSGEKQPYVVNMHITPGGSQISMVQLGMLVTYQIDIYKEVPWLKT